MAYLKWLLPLTLLYVMLTGNIEPLNWVFGLLIAAFVTWLIRPKPTPIVWSHLPQATLAVVIFVGKLQVELIVSGVQVARMIVQPQLTIRQGIVGIPDATEQGWVTTVSAEAITLTPGELVVEIGEDGTLYTHTLNLDETLEKSAEAQVKRAHQLEDISA